MCVVWVCTSDASSVHDPTNRYAFYFSQPLNRQQPQPLSKEKQPGPSCGEHTCDAGRFMRTGAKSRPPAAESFSPPPIHVFSLRILLAWLESSTICSPSLGPFHRGHGLAPPAGPPDSRVPISTTSSCSIPSCHDLVHAKSTNRAGSSCYRPSRLNHTGLGWRPMPLQSGSRAERWSKIKPN
jgi:hypothetical protein